MPTNPEKPIAKALQAWSRTRRTQARGSFSLSPEHRRQLQAEVDRVFPKAFAAPGWIKSFLDAWPRFAVPTYATIALLALIALVFLIPRIPSTSTELAQNNPANLSRADRSAAREAASANPEEPSELQFRSRQDALPPASVLTLAPENRKASGQGLGFADAEMPRALSLSSATTTPVAPTPSPEPDQTQVATAAVPPPQLTVLAQRTEALAALNVSGPAVTPLASAAPATSAPIAAAAESVRFVFTREQLGGVPEAQVQPPSSAPLLSSFEIRTEGTNVHFRDSDGSLYDGTIEDLRADEINRSTLTTGFRFNARGTNRSMNQLVTLSGRLEPLIAAATPIPSDALALATRSVADAGAAPARAGGGGAGGGARAGAGRGGAGGRGGGGGGRGVAGPAPAGVASAAPALASANPAQSAAAELSRAQPLASPTFRMTATATVGLTNQSATIEAIGLLPP